MAGRLGLNVLTGFVALVGLGLPDTRTLLGGVLGPERKHRGQRLVLAEHGDRAEPEVARLHGPQLGQVQGAVGLDPLDEHPIHQVPMSFAYVATSDRNTYDRCIYQALQHNGETEMLTGLVQVA